MKYSRVKFSVKEKAHYAKSENFSAHLLSCLGPASMGRVITVTACPLILLALNNAKGSYLFRMIFYLLRFQCYGVYSGIANG